MLAKIAVTLNVLSFVLTIVSLTVPSWYYWSTTVVGLTAYIKFGLWKWCGEIPLFVSGCFRLEDSVHPISIQIKVARAMVVLSTLPTVMAAGLAFLNFVRRRDRRSLLLAAGLLSTVAGLMSIVGTVVFVVDNQIEKYFENEDGSIQHLDLKPHASFALCLTSGLLNLTGALLYIIDAFCVNRNRVANTETRTET